NRPWRSQLRVTARPARRGSRTDRACMSFGMTSSSSARMSGFSIRSAHSHQLALTRCSTGYSFYCQSVDQLKLARHLRARLEWLSACPRRGAPLCLRVTQVLGKVGHPIIVQLRGLLNLLGNRLPRLGYVRLGISNLTVETGSRSLKLQDPRFCNETFFEQRQQRGSFVLD